MDPITHGLLGASAVQATLGNKQIKNLWLAGALAAMAPDLDVFIAFINHQPFTGEIWHRSFTHSLLFIPLGALVVSLFLFLFTGFRQAWKLTFLACLLGYSTHCLLDAATAYGTLLYWPWLNTRVSWDIVAIVDPFVTLPLAFGLVWSIRNKDKIAALYGLLFVAIFLTINAFQHYRAIEIAEAFGKKFKLNFSQIRAMPALASSTNWQIIAKYNNCFLVANTLVPVGSHTQLSAIQYFPAFSFAETKLNNQQIKDGEIFSWFSQNNLILAQREPLTVADGRYIASYQPAIALWGYELAKSGEWKKINQVHLNVIQKSCGIELYDNSTSVIAEVL